MKTFTVTVTYTGEVEAECAEDIEAKLWVVHEIIGHPFDGYLFDAEHIDIDGIGEEE